MQDWRAGGRMIGELVEYGGCRPAAVYGHDSSADAGAEIEDAGEYVLLTLPMPAELGSPVEADLANVADSWQQLGEQRQFARALPRTWRTALRCVDRLCCAVAARHCFGTIRCHHTPGSFVPAKSPVATVIAGDLNTASSRQHQENV